MGCNSSKHAPPPQVEKEVASRGSTDSSRPHPKMTASDMSQTADSFAKKQQRTYDQAQAGATGTFGFSSDTDVDTAFSSTITVSKPERLYKILAKAQTTTDPKSRDDLLKLVLQHCQQEPSAAAYRNPNTKSTPLHLACRLLDTDLNDSRGSAGDGPIDMDEGLNESDNGDEKKENEEEAPVKPRHSSLFAVIRTLIAVYRDALKCPDVAGNIPLHYAIAPTTHFQNAVKASNHDWPRRAVIVRHIIDADYHAARAYLTRNDIVFESSDATGGCSPLYRVLQTLPDDFNPAGPTVVYASVLHSTAIVGMGNASDADKPLALLYRRFTRQFDISEKFFAGDNSRAPVVLHRKRYKNAAGNTWKIMELLLRPPMATVDASQPQSIQPYGIVHRAVQVETPPDLLRYIVETNAQDLTRVDAEGNLPLHYAAKSKPPLPSQPEQARKSFPAFYTKFVVDELLYKFRDGASMRDSNGSFPLALAIHSGKQWIGGGIKSLYKAYPEALQEIDLQEHSSLRVALSMSEDDTKTEAEIDAGESPTLMSDASDEGPPNSIDGIIKDEQHDAIMLVQQEGVDISEVTTSMWAHEEDAAVQMLGCIAIGKMAANPDITENDILRISLTAVAALVNAMKAHPDEVIIQEKACLALKYVAKADGRREVSMVASGAVSAIVGAMQAHVSDAGVQEEACGAIATIVRLGGADRATVVASVSGVTAILNAIAAHPKSEGVQVQGCSALLSLTEFPNANLPELPRTQTEPLLVAAKNNFPEKCGGMVDKIMASLT